jgi:hypothetical protein
VRVNELKAADARLASANSQPSRLPSTWKPTPVEPPRAPAAPRVEPRHNTESPPLREEDLPEDVRANLAALDRQFEWADRFVNPPKRKV